MRSALGLRDTWFTHYRVGSSAQRGPLRAPGELGAAAARGGRWPASSSRRRARGCSGSSGASDGRWHAACAHVALGRYRVALTGRRVPRAYGAVTGPPSASLAARRSALGSTGRRREDGSPGRCPGSGQTTPDGKRTPARSALPPTIVRKSSLWEVASRPVLDTRLTEHQRAGADRRDPIRSLRANGESRRPVDRRLRHSAVPVPPATSHDLCIPKLLRGCVWPRCRARRCRCSPRPARAPTRSRSPQADAQAPRRIRQRRAR